MNLKLVLKWIAVLALGSIAWVALGLGHSPFDFLGMVAGCVCLLFCLDCIETATGIPINTYRFLIVVFVVDVILVHFHATETASVPIALIIAWKFEGLMLKDSAAKEIRKLTGLGADEVVRLSPDELSERMKERRGEEGSLKK
jgi:hypothetical protein